ncbi:MAG: hypothetical protein MK237_09845, partial [Gemmatimonadetes bacterium]|nr:hypothetical protein [Gemmatimonadota bacterium]
VEGLDPAGVGESELLAPAPEGVPVRKIRQPIPTPSPAASAGPGGQVRIQAEGYTADGRRQRKEKKKGKKRQRVDKDAVQSNIQRVRRRDVHRLKSKNLRSSKSVRRRNGSARQFGSTSSLQLPN